MSALSDLQIEPLDRTCLERARARQQRLTKPPGSLGRLEDIALDLAAIQGTEQPRARQAAALLFAADHPVTRHGVSAYPAAVTRAMLGNFVQGGAAASVLARQQSIALGVIDVGVAPGPEPSFLATDSGVQAATAYRDPVADDPAGDLRVEDAMSSSTFERALGAGRRAVAELNAETCVVLFGEMGIGNTTVASAVCAGLLGGEPAEFVGAGTGVAGSALETKQRVVQEAVARLRGEADPLEVLRRVGGRDVAALAGAMAEAAARRLVIVVDGFISSAAALALVRALPAARPFMIFSHRSQERGHARVLEALAARPLLDLSLRLGEASGALLAYPLIELACAVHNGMATFEAAGVPEQDVP
ncbi:MAG TPA: nicotinate-nucleotide--dimethylbenzimidazole phosphoribosyltransferase [Polyangiaceae bacterium]|nr:nicotinate-nucleotide--dimethylbenzimidazole phosphoribosyltransferase [Polyangiaceae bacterium]